MWSVSPLCQGISIRLCSHLRQGDGMGHNWPSPTARLKSTDTSLPFSRRIFPKYLCLGGVACLSRISTRKGPILLVNTASVAGSVFKVGMTNSVKAIFGVVIDWSIEKAKDVWLCWWSKRLQFDLVIYNLSLRYSIPNVSVRVEFVRWIGSRPRFVAMSW